MTSYCDEDHGFDGMAEDEIAYFMAKSGRASELPWDAVSALYFHFPELRGELAREYPELRARRNDELTGDTPTITRHGFISHAYTIGGNHGKLTQSNRPVRARTTLGGFARNRGAFPRRGERP